MILFTADWHIKLGQKNVPASWALNRYNLLFEKIRELEKSCIMHIIGGDLFDRLPTMEELELYFSFVRGVSCPTIVYDGNHEATKKGRTFFSQLKRATKDINPLVRVIDNSYVDEDLNFSILPYRELHAKNSIEAFDSSMPIFTHVRGEIPPHVKPEVDLDRFEDFPVVFSGDLHAHSNTQRNIVYPGSPVTTSFHRNHVDTGYLLINEDNWTWLWEKFELPQLIRRTVTSADDMIGTEYDHTIYELEGDIQALAAVKSSELLDKKVVRRNSEVNLIMSPEMSIQDELSEYLLYVLGIKEDNLQSILGTYNDYAQKAKVE